MTFPAPMSTTPPALSYTNSINNRTSSNGTFASYLANGAASGANVLAGATNVAAPFVPGSSVLSAALNQTAGQLRASNVPGDMAAMATHPGGAAIPGGQPDFVASAEQMHKQMVESNAYLLTMQQKFTQLGLTVNSQSNALKAKSDAEKNTVANFRS